MASTHDSTSAPAAVTSTPATPNVRLTWAAIALAVVCLFWAGMIFSNGFNTGIKFTAPTLTRAVGMDVGRVTFSAFNKIELFWCVATLCLFVFARPFRRAPRATGVLLALVWLIVVLQTAFLLPVLIEHTQLIMHGQPIPKSPVHTLYTSSELAKLLALLVAGIGIIRQLRNPAASD